MTKNVSKELLKNNPFLLLTEIYISLVLTVDKMLGTLRDCTSVM